MPVGSYRGDSLFRRHQSYYSRGGLQIQKLLIVNRFIPHKDKKVGVISYNLSTL